MTPREVARLVDVAERAGVTISTASRALARPEMVRPETRARVEAAVAELGYVPNRAARSLITGATATIAIMVPDLATAYFASICQAAQVAARERGYAVFIVDTGNDEQQEAEVVRTMSRWIDGVIICNALRSYRPGNAPMVFVNRRARGSHAVLLDQVGIVSTQIEYLRFLGHRRIAWINGPSRHWATAIRRRAAERLAIRSPVDIVDWVAPTFEGGQEAVKVLDPATTAVAAFNDSQAVGILSTCADLGIRVPEDLSVIGADGTRLGYMVTPTLTSVQAPLRQMARTAVSLLLDHLGGEVATIEETLSVELVVRHSTAPLSTLGRPAATASTGARRVAWPTMDIEQFYDADPRRRASEEVAFGHEWTDADGGRYEVMWIADTGEVYAMFEPVEPIASDAVGDVFVQHMPTSAVTVEVLATVATREEIDQRLAGWEAAMSGADSITWIRTRL